LAVEKLNSQKEHLKKKFSDSMGRCLLNIFELVIEMIEMPRNIYVVLYILVLIVVVVSVDLLFFKNRFWERLIVISGIVLVFATPSI